MNKAKKLACLVCFSALFLIGSKYAPNSDSAFVLIVMGLTLFLCIPAFELEAYFRRNENKNENK